MSRLIISTATTVDAVMTVEDSVGPRLGVMLLRYQPIPA